ncbi:MAG: NYN domain-containing protein [Candidatus Neomarinimicrobiota bacterium]
MSQKLIIDGYNLIHATPGLLKYQKRSLEKARERLIAIVAPFSKRRKLQVIIVFDGVQDDIIPMESAVSRWVQVRFSPPHKKADTIIIELIQAEPNPRRCTVVTSDRAVANGVKYYGTTTVKSEDFARLLEPRRNSTTAENAEQKPEMAPGDLEVWKRVFGIE